VIIKILIIHVSSILTMSNFYYRKIEEKEKMKVSKLIKKLQDVFKHSGDLDITVDTEACKFSCHLVEIKKVYVTPKSSGVNVCYLSLDPTVMK
jgi:hypothetical protein